MAFYRVNGEQRLKVLGQFGVLTVTEARKRARKLLLDAEDGIGPKAEQEKKEAATVTVRSLGRHCLEEHAVPKKRPRLCRSDPRSSICFERLRAKPTILMS